MLNNKQWINQLDRIIFNHSGLLRRLHYSMHYPHPTPPKKNPLALEFPPNISKKRITKVVFNFLLFQFSVYFHQVAPIEIFAVIQCFMVFFFFSLKKFEADVQGMNILKIVLLVAFSFYDWPIWNWKKIVLIFHEMRK